LCLCFRCFSRAIGPTARCNALGIEPVITTTDTSSVQEFADLVEYCHGDETTVQGKKRIADGHPAKYDVRYFELGNGD
jgi:alpha-N-arabinofuranosidase